MVYVMAREYEYASAANKILSRYYMERLSKNKIPIRILREAIAENLREIDDKLKDIQKF